MQNHNKIFLILGATICFTVRGVAFAQAGSAQSGGAGQGAASGQSPPSGRGGATPQTGHTGQDTSAASASGAGSSSGQTPSASADQKFAQNAAAGSAAEIEMGHLAADKAVNDKVKQFGQRMVTDHTKASDELKALASKKGMALSDTPKPKDKAMIQKMSKMSGAAFDKAYMQDMVKDHQKDVAEFQKEANSGSDPDLKAWAGTTLPILQEHLRMAKEALSAVNGENSGGTGNSPSAR
ncbi:MAG: putative rane protein [Bryobacterales bacterium]|jgi:putative membrane protein|nr:putative rane protein [Bryobacterales bacterium]